MLLLAAHTGQGLKLSSGHAHSSFLSRSRWWQMCLKSQISQFPLEMLHLALLVQRKYSGEPQFSNCKEFLMFLPEVTPPVRQHVLPVSQYFHSPTKRTLALADLELIPLPTWSGRILGDIFWQQSLVQQIRWILQLLFPNLGFVLTPDSFTTKRCGLVDKLLCPAFRGTSLKWCCFPSDSFSNSNVYIFPWKIWKC